MTREESFSVVRIGTVVSGLTSRELAPKQGAEGAPAAWIEIDRRFAAGLDGIDAGQEVLVLTWLHESRRDTLRVRPRDDATNPELGVFATRSADRVGLHRVRVLDVRGARLYVHPIEAIAGMPVVDIKPVIGS